MRSTISCPTFRTANIPKQRASFRRHSFSEYRKQILPDRLQRDILEELFLKGGLEHMSPELRRKVHDEMQRVRENYVLPPAAKIEQFLQHFPPLLRDELRQVLEQTQAS
uniref:(northern house mosquito) hypothetical protein n=1 Tax=Culex pipiens TaxID=7175 RepID=A0A8D8CT70_CULPI